MENLTTIEGQMVLDQAASVAIICARFNSFIVDHLEAGCVDTLQRAANCQTEAHHRARPGRV